MGVRADKSKAVVRYLTGHTGIPLLGWNGTGRLESPAPYVIDLTTSRKLENWHNLLRVESKPVTVAIRYDNDLPSIDQAWVGMQMTSFIPLITAHYESISDRIEKE